MDALSCVAHVTGAIALMVYVIGKLAPMAAYDGLGLLNQVVGFIGAILYGAFAAILLVDGVFVFWVAL